MSAITPALRLTVLCAAALLPSAAHAATYRCQDAGGRLVYSDRPCTGSQTQAGTLTEGGARKAAVEPPMRSAASSAGGTNASGSAVPRDAASAPQPPASAAPPPR